MKSVGNQTDGEPRGDLFLIDAIGPFFRGYHRRTINWSKIPFAHLKLDGPEAELQWTQIREDFGIFCAKVAALGFNAISLDDVTHLAEHPAYEIDVRARILQWRSEFQRCFAIASEHGLSVYLTMDVFSATPGVRAHLESSHRSIDDFLADLLTQFFTDLPQVSGVIIRIGESDGKDVKDDFRSELYLTQPEQVNRFLKRLLPVFETAGRTLIFRTWTVGAHRVGDLMWHGKTFERVLRGVEDSPALIVSMKYGESDFFRYLPLSRNFFRTRCAKIVELQTKREYEGCGEYPSFTGWEYERYARVLAHAVNLRGIMVWCQTGGWVPFRRLAFIDQGSVWTELSTFVTIRVFKEKLLVEDAVHQFAKTRGLQNGHALLELLRLSDDVIRELLYVEDFARHPLFFRRVRIPPMLSVYWHNVFVNHSVKKVLSYFVHNKAASLSAARVSLDKLSQMKILAKACGMPESDIEYMQDTFHLLALARDYYLLPFTPEIELKLRTAKKAYKAKYPKDGTRYRYRIKLNFQPFWFKARHIGLAFSVLMRNRSSYRWVDRFFTLHILSLIYRIIAKRRPHWIPEFARESAMGVDTVFR